MISSLWGCFQIYQPMPGSISASETVADLWSSLTDTPNLQYERQGSLLYSPVAEHILNSFYIVCSRYSCIWNLTRTYACWFSHHILYIDNTVILCSQGLYSTVTPYPTQHYERISDTYQHVESAFVLITYCSITMNNSDIVLCNGTAIYCWAALLISWWTGSWVHIQIYRFRWYISLGSKRTGCVKGK